MKFQIFIRPILVVATTSLLSACGGETTRTTVGANSAQLTSEEQANIGEQCDSNDQCVGTNVCIQEQCAAASATAANAAPVPTNGSLSVRINNSITSTVSAADGDADTLAYSISDQPNNGTVELLDADQGTFRYTPDEDYVGSDTFTFIANDGIVDSTAGTIDISVLGDDISTSLTASWQSDSNIVLEWQGGDDSETIIVQRKANQESDFTELTQLTGGATQYSDTDIAANGRYDYRLVANYTSAQQIMSNDAIARTTPSATTDIVVVRQGGSEATLTWTALAPFATGYRVERATDTVNYEAVATLAPTATDYTDDDIERDNTYQWRIVALADQHASPSTQVDLTLDLVRSPLWTLPDTGVANCRTLVSSASSPCPTLESDALYGQDAQYGTISMLYTNNGDETVTDEITELMWQRGSSPSTYTWSGAKAYCQDLTLAGYSDWRLPDRHELTSIVDFTTDFPAIDSVFTGTANGIYWTNTSFFTIAIYIHFSNGTLANIATTTLGNARCVRG